MQMDSNYIEKHDVIRRYNQHKLSDEELDSFEIYILDNPDIISVIEQEQAIFEAFKEHESLLQDKQSGVANQPWLKGLAMAACLVVAVVVVFNISGGRQEFALREPVRLETFRGAGDNAVRLGGQPVVQFQVDMGPPQFLDSQAFTAELVDGAGVASFRATGLAVDADGWLYYALPGQEDVLSGAYEVRVYPDGNPANATTYPVRFTAP